VARDLMTPDILAVDAQMTLAQTAAFLLEQGITGAPVRDAEHAIVGFVSTSDLLQAVAGADGPDAGGLLATPVTALMTPEVYTIDVDAPVREIAQTLIDGGIHRVFVEEEGDLVGTITSSDLVGLLIDAD
jgi:CBS domain-containing protein